MAIWFLVIDGSDDMNAMHMMTPQIYITSGGQVWPDWH